MPWCTTPTDKCNFASLFQPVGRNKVLLMRARLVDKLRARVQPLHCIDNRARDLVSLQRAVDSTPISQIQGTAEV